MTEIRTTIAICLSLFLPAALAQPPAEVEQLTRSDKLTLGALVDEVVQSYPVYDELPARLEEAAKYDDMASSLFADTTNVVLRYQTGQIGNNDNLREYEAGLTLSLWRFGQRKASQEVARGMELETNTFGEFVRWELAGILRASLWRIELTTDRVAKAKKAAEVSADLLRGTQRRVDLGTLPSGDLLQVKQDLLNSDIRLSSAEVEYANAVRAYQIITELSVAPADITEKRSLKSGVTEQHPALVYSTARAGRASAEYHLQQESGTDSPNLLLGVRSERGGTDLTFEDSVGFIFSYPLGFGSHVNSERAAAGVRAAGVRAEHRDNRRKLEVAAHDAERNLAGAEREDRFADQKNELAQQHLDMSVRAFELGEIDLMRFLIIKERAYRAEMDASQKEIRRRSAIADYNQAVGEVP